MTTGYPTPGPERPAAWRSLTQELADLCRRDATRFARVVRESDRLEAAGVERDEAIRQALNTP